MAKAHLTVGSRRLEGEQYLLPSGAKATIRGLTVKELDKLANRRKLKSGVAYNEILEACAGIDPLKALVGDRVFALIAVRMETHGPEFAFRSRCPHCGNQFNQAVDLESLEVRELTTGQGPFELTLPKSGKQLTWRLLTGADELRLSQEFAEEMEEHGLSMALALRTTAIAGEAMVSRKFFEQLSGRDAEAFYAEISAKDCGVMTSLEIECPRCESSFETSLDLGPTFLLPPKQALK